MVLIRVAILGIALSLSLLAQGYGGGYTSPPGTSSSGGSPAGSAVTDAQCWASASTFGVCASPHFDAPTVTTQSQGDNSTKTASTRYADGVLKAQYKVKSCVVVVGDPGAASPALADDNDSPVACSNDTGGDWTLTSVACWANAGSPTVTPILTGGSGTSILTGALTCGTASWAAGSVQGTAPVVHTFSGAGATCSSTPCSIDANITTAGGTAKYLVIKIVGTY